MRSCTRNTIETLHDKIHAMAKDAVKAYNGGDKTKAGQIFREMENLSVQIGSLLDGIKGEYR